MVLKLLQENQTIKSSSFVLLEPKKKYKSGQNNHDTLILSDIFLFWFNIKVLCTLLVQRCHCIRQSNEIGT